MLQLFNSHQYPEGTHEHLEMVRLLNGTLSTKDNNALIHRLQTQDGTPFDKLVRYAIAQDENKAFQTALNQAYQNFSLLGIGLSWAAFVLGAITSLGVLQSEWLNFFYVLIALLGWHTISLMLWLIGQGRSFGSPLVAGAIDGVLHKAPTLSKNPINKTAWQILAQSTAPKRRWLIGKLVHQTWAFSLLGSVVSLFLLFLSKRYDFVWESTLLSSSHMHTIIQVIGVVPSWLGFDLPTDTPSPKSLAVLLMLAIVVYGIVPRLIAYAYCHLQANRIAFCIDGTLHYYENLLRQFANQIVSPDDYVAPITKPNAIKPNTNAKVVLSFERTPNDPLWYQLGAGLTVVNFGVLDNTQDFERLRILLQEKPLSLYVGIDTRILPDRGVLRKFEKLIALANHGLAVELFTTHGDTQSHKLAWQKALTNYGIEKVYY